MMHNLLCEYKDTSGKLLIIIVILLYSVRRNTVVVAPPRPPCFPPDVDQCQSHWRTSFNLNL